mgnify:CR=1 FL=1
MTTKYKPHQAMTDENEVIVGIKLPKKNPSIIMVLGVGGAGGNAVNHMWNTGIKGVNFLICNTDQRAMDNSPVEDKIRLGHDGLGAGNDPERSDFWIYFTVTYSSPSMSIESRYMSPQKMSLMSFSCL